MVILFAFAVLSLQRKLPAQDVVRVSVTPSATDPAIDTFDSDHTIFIDPTVGKRNQLLLFIPGTNGKSRGSTRFCELGAREGYHVISLMYPDDISATIAARDSNSDAMLNFRLEILEGGDKSPYIKVNRANSVENRLIKVLQWLAKNRPTENWKQFVDSQGGIEWSKVATSGLSQGAGHAVLLGIRHHLARVVSFGGPKDYDRHLGKPASWYTKPATPIGAFFTFNHKQDKQGCDFIEQMEICRTLGLEALGKPVDVDSETSPFHGSRILYTNFPGTTLTSGVAHTSVVNDTTTPVNSDGKLRFEPVWRYMLTAPIGKG